MQKSDFHEGLKAAHPNDDRDIEMGIDVDSGRFPCVFAYTGPSAQ